MMFSKGSFTFTIAPSTLLSVSKTLVNKKRKAAPCESTLILFLSSSVSRLTEL